ncbi:MAG: RraA family protein [Actinomycetota bacterium]|nr:RraA family protein [Actinomycetota bacterium]MEC9473784.1 RraA family protein [Actinomycetota bacterium]
MPELTELETLREFDTPTICNAIEIIVPERRVEGFTTKPFICHDPSLPPMVGYARTAKIRATTPSGRNKVDDMTMRVDYFKHIAEGPAPTVTVIEDIDEQVGFGAHWGEVNSNLHKGLGSVGVVTNGSIRDVDMWAEGFGALAGSLGPSHGWVHVVEYAIPVEVHGMVVSPGDIIHADRHGAVVIPDSAVSAIKSTVDRLEKAEARLIGPAQQPEFDIEELITILDPDGRDH